MDKPTKNLLIFFIATFLLTWACYVPIAITGNSPYQMPWMTLLILGGAGPSIVGVAMTFLALDKAERREYWLRCFSPRRISPLWWLIIFVLFPIIYVVVGALAQWLGSPLPGMEKFTDLMANPAMWPLAAFISFMSGPWSEEFGWRGVSLEPMLKRFGVIPGTALLGIIWGVWHLPLFFMPATWHGQMGFQLAGFWMFIVYSIGLSLLMTWVYQNTERSILSGMLMHFTSNFTSQLSDPTSPQFQIIRALAFLIVGLVVVAFGKRQKQNKSKDGWK